MKTKALRKIEKSKSIKITINESDFKEKLVDALEKIVNHKCYVIIFMIMALLSFIGNALYVTSSSHPYFYPIFFTVLSITFLMQLIRLPLCPADTRSRGELANVCIWGFNLALHIFCFFTNE